MTRQARLEKTPSPVMLGVHMGAVPCCIELSRVLRVLSLMALRPIPGSPAYIKGFFNYGGRNVLVIDLAERLAGEAASAAVAYTLDTPVVICQGENGIGGLIVESVDGLVPVRSGGHGDDLFAGTDLPFVDAVQGDHGPRLWVDIEQALRVRLVAEDLPIAYDPEHYLNAALAGEPVA